MASELEKKFFSAERRRKLSDEGKAMGGGTFPIESPKDVKNAVHLWVTGHHQTPAAKSHIMRQAKKLGCTHLLPSDWGVSKVFVAGDVVKMDESRRLVFGWASIMQKADGTTIYDSQEDFMDDTWELEKMAYRYVLHYRDGGEMHQTKGVSTLVESMVFTPEKIAKLGLPAGSLPIGWWVGFKVDDARVWANKDKYLGFSIGGHGVRSKVDA